MSRLREAAGTASQVARVLAHAGALVAADTAVLAWRRATGRGGRGGLLRANGGTQGVRLGRIPAESQRAFLAALELLDGDLGLAAARAAQRANDEGE